MIGWGHGPYPLQPIKSDMKTPSRITRIEFLNKEERRNRQVRVTLSAGECYTIDPLWGGYIQRTTPENAQRTLDLAFACIGYLNGDFPESISYMEIAHAADAFREDCMMPEDMDWELYEDARMDFISRLSKFEDWEARV